MKKYPVICLCLCLILLLMVGGCGKGSTTTGNQTNTKATDNTVKGTSTKQTDRINNSDQRNPQPNTGSTKPDGSNAGTKAANNGTPGSNGSNPRMGAPNYFGQVTKVSGNSITVALAKMPERNAEPPANPPAEQSGNQGQNPPAAEGDVQKMGPPGDMRSPELTGESKTITINQDTQIMAGGRDNTNKITIANIKTGDMIGIWYKDGDDKSAVEMLRVMGAQP